RERVLDEVDAHLARERGGAEAAHRPRRLRQQDGIAVLVDKAVEEAEAPLQGRAVAEAARALAGAGGERLARRDALQVEGGGGARPVRLQLIHKPSVLLELVRERVGPDLERERRVLRVAPHAVPRRERLHQPRGRPPAPPRAEPVAVVPEGTGERL